MIKNSNDSEKLVILLEYIQRNGNEEIVNFLKELNQIYTYNDYISDRLFLDKDELSRVLNNFKTISDFFRNNIKNRFNGFSFYDSLFLNFIKSIPASQTGLIYYVEKAKILRDLEITHIYLEKKVNGGVYMIPIHNAIENVIELPTSHGVVYVYESYVSCVKKSYSDKPITYNLMNSNYYGDGSKEHPFKNIPTQIEVTYDPNSSWQMEVEEGSSFDTKRIYLPPENPMSFDASSMPSKEELAKLDDPIDLKEAKRLLLTK